MALVLSVKECLTERPVQQYESTLTSQCLHTVKHNLSVFGALISHSHSAELYLITSENILHPNCWLVLLFSYYMRGI